MNIKQPTCGCCAGIEVSTPAVIYNRPSLNSLQYRVGDYAHFLDTMLARLSELCLADEAACKAGLGHYPLQKLTTRSPDDFAIVLLHGWATVADVLTFYQERLANEGYLRTATERRSVLELARLIGYEPRAGVSASVFLAYTLDDNFKAEALIAKGSRSQSIPEPNELPQSFETSDDLTARAAWNNLQPRKTRPQTAYSLFFDSRGPRVYLKGISTKLNVDDPLLIDFEGNNKPSFYRVKEVIPEAAENRTLVMLQTEVSLFDSPFSLDELFHKEYQFILLDSGEGLPGFFEIDDSLDNSGQLPIRSLNDGSLWLLAVINEKNGVFIKLSQADKQFVYEVKAVEGIDNPSFRYARFILQSIQDYANILAGLTQSPSLPPRNTATLSRELTMQFQGAVMAESAMKVSLFNTVNGNSIEQSAVTQPQSMSFVTKGLNVVAEASNAVAKRFAPALNDHLATATANTSITENNPIKVYALRTKAAPFGYNAPLRQVEWNESRRVYKTAEWEINDPFNEKKVKTDTSPTITTTEFHTPNELYLDADYDLSPNSWVVIEHSTGYSQVIRLSNDSIEHGALAAYGMSGKTTQLSLGKDTWFTAGDTFSNVVRHTRIYIQSEALELAEESLSAAVCGGSEDLIELDGYYENLQAGRWVIVSGERADITGTSGVRFSELAMLSVVQQDIFRQAIYIRSRKIQFTLSGDKIHSFIKLAKPLSYCFKRDTVKIYGNVVKATNGETRQEVLGSGNGAKTLQAFTLKQPPLTFVSAANPSGVDSTLKVIVNGVEWHESKSLNTLTPNSRSFISKTDDDSKTTVIFGNGKQGARPPTGVDNIKALYRSGIGKAGNVKAQQVSLLVSRPLGVKEVINPLRASGGADKETRDQARKNAPLAVMALDRLVSVQDYQDFSRTYAGIGKASATEIFAGCRQTVQVTIAGIDDSPIDETSDLFINLRQALHDFGDPFQPIQLAVRELLLLVISAKVKINPYYQWELVVASLRTALLEAFGFERRELGQDVMLGEVISVMQAVAGVEYVDVDAFGGIPEKAVDAAGQLQRLTPAQIAESVQKIAQRKKLRHHLKVNLAKREGNIIRPAQIAFLTPDVPESLILNQLL
jgi:hypothetical protein